jgi:hypothetical protein
VGPVAYKLKMNPGWRVHPVFHVSLLEPYREDGRVQPPPHPIEMEGTIEYEVESILEHRFWGTRNPKAYYKVAWKGYGIEHNSWEPESNVVNAPEIVADYWKRLTEKQERLCLFSKLSEHVLPTTSLSRLAQERCSPKCEGEFPSCL